MVKANAISQDSVSGNPVKTNTHMVKLQGLPGMRRMGKGALV
jgi:hypothetical protein